MTKTMKLTKAKQDEVRSLVIQTLTYAEIVEIVDALGLHRLQGRTLCCVLDYIAFPIPGMDRTDVEHARWNTGRQEAALRIAAAQAALAKRDNSDEEIPF